MDFIDSLRQLASKVESLKDVLTTEEATKSSIVMPFFAMLGYDVFNPEEFLPEYVADVGTKKGEKVDYAILKDGAPVILVECKWIGEDLNAHDSQLFRYFAVSKAKFGILTNGRIYRFYTDIEKSNLMDEKPFLELDILNLRDPIVNELKKFRKDYFDIGEIFDTAEELKYVNEIRRVMASELEEPSDEFVKHFLQLTYSGMKTQSVVEKFRPIVKKSIQQFISDMMNDKIQGALKASTNEPVTEEPKVEAQPVDDKKKRIVTTEEELMAFFIVQNLLRDSVAPEEITYKDTESYFNVLYKNNSRKWICRLILTPTRKTLIVPDSEKNGIQHPLSTLYEIENYKEELQTVLTRYMEVGQNKENEQ